MEDLIDPTALELAVGKHDKEAGQYCAMELASYVSGEPWTDHPKCTSRTIGAFCRSLNDRTTNERRQRLLSYIVQCDDNGIPIVENGMLKPGPIVGTNTGPQDDKTRSWMCMNWLVHEYLPAMLRAAGLTEHAENLEALITITDATIYASVRPTVTAAIHAANGGYDSWYERECARIAGAGAVAVSAGAGAEAVAVAVAVAGAVAGAGAGAGADGKIVLGLAIEAASSAKAEGGGYSAQYNAAYAVFRPQFDEKYAEIGEGLFTSSLLLLDGMIEVGKTSEKQAA